MTEFQQTLLIIGLMPIIGFVVGVACAYFMGKGHGKRKK